jgi:hypothetical protein
VTYGSQFKEFQSPPRHPLTAYGPTLRFSAPLAAEVWCAQGQLLVRSNSTGYCLLAAEGEGVDAYTSAGLACGDANNKAADARHSGFNASNPTVGAAGAQDPNAWAGIFDLKISTLMSDGLTNAAIGRPCYAIDPYTVGALPEGPVSNLDRTVAGLFLGVNEDTGRARVWLGPQGGALAKIIAGL